MRQPLTAVELDEWTAKGCGSPGCTETHNLVLTARCHLGRGTIVQYFADTKTLVIKCFVCQKIVSEVLVCGGKSR